MNELIGLKSINSLTSLNNIKQELLIFDKLFIVGLQEWKEVIEEKRYKDSRNFLEQKGLISLNDFVIYQGYLWMYEEANKVGGWDKYYNENINDNLTLINQNIEFLIKEGKILYNYQDLNPNKKFTETSKQISPIIESKLKQSKTQTSYDFLQVCNLCHDLKTRIISTSYNDSKFSAIPCNTSIYNVENITNVKAEVYNLILEDFPIVKTDNISWEQIFDFKKDPEIYNSIWGLRNWISNISKSNKNIAEIEEEYRHLKYKYEQAIKIHKLKTGNSMFQTTVQMSAELLENVAKLKIRKLSDLLFKFKENKISLMESELKSNGNQFSYLFKIKEKFK
ncbi:hypothetical protein HBA12_00165 [Tenacibaculum mesophilum]|uniref:hypothetical protein n=1 Tax=Tenacibaculum mesophilum TaxID=104268 RepID=UPI00142FCEE7|nr:hypothetical protein [Tenacibaculum mesophilum]KAF9658695.1 hypothetical protein HBA12_00165 [Tenacibaculum mesophilum]